MGIVSYTAGTAVRAGMRHAAQQQRQAPRHDGTVAVRQQNTLQRAQPPREPVDGAVLLTNVCKWLKRYLYLDSDAKYWALTLWVAGSHFRDEAGFLVHDTYPIAGFLSSEPGSGKTHALELLSILCPAAPGILVEPSEAAVALLVAKHHRTLLLDEADILFGSGRRKAAIRAILNSGYKKGGTWDRVRKGDVDSVRTDGAKAIAALSVVKTGTGSALEALMTRIVEWEMHKPPPGTVVCKLRERFGTDSQGVPITGLSVGAHLNGQMADWAAQERAALAAMTLELPEGVELREEEKWGPLLGVGARAEANRQAREDEDAREDGDDWAELAWQACVDMSLYGGTPDTAETEADMFAAIIGGWDAPGALEADGWNASPGPAPAATYRAACYMTPPGSETAFPVPFLTQTWATPAKAREAVQDAAGTPLHWQQFGEQDWGATIGTGDGPVFDYAVSAVTSSDQEE